MPGVVHRLYDIETEEVSLVDRAANKKKFLLVKREGEGTMDHLVADGRGGFKRIAKADKPEDDEEAKRKAAEKEAAEKAAAKPPPFPPKKPGDKPEEEDPKKKPGDKAPPFGKKPAAKADAAGGALADDLQELCEEMMDVISDMQGEEEAEPESKKDKAKKVLDKAKAAIDAHKAAKKPPTPPTPPEEDEETKKAALAKAGRKISQARLDKLKGALAALDGVLKEVEGAGAGDADKEKTAKAAKEGTVDEELKKSIATLIENSTKVIEENTKLAKRIDEQDQTITQLKKGVPAPNSASPERTPAKKTDAEKPWPMNMNPRRSSRVAKGGKTDDKDDSFLDD